MAGWDTERDNTLRTHHSAGLTLGATAKAMALSKASISRRAADLGLKWDRTQVKVATAARTADAKERRSILALRLLDDTERLRVQLWEPCTAFNFGGRDNTYAEHDLNKPIFADQLKIMQAVGIAIDRSLKLTDHDADTRDMPAVDQWLAHMTGGQVPDGS